LKPELSGFKKYLDRSLFETPTYAIIVKDDKNNIFVLRRKKDTDMIMLGGGLENPLVKISEIAKSESIEISLSISVQSISEEQYDMLKKWEPVQRENVEPFFKNTKFSKIYEPSDEEILLLKKIKDSDFKISDLIKYIDKKIK
jgi:isochorismate hydrolase